MPSNLSVSPQTRAEYSLPEGDDSKNISEFLQRNSEKQIVAVQGLGFVGTVMSLVVANNDAQNYAVVGIDQNSIQSYWKIAEINGGDLPVVSSDPLVSSYYENTRSLGNFYATYDSAAIAAADVVIVDINLDVAKEKSEDGKILSYDVPLEGFKKAMCSIGENCKPDVLILVETTVPPGTCSKVVFPIIVECLSKRGLPTNTFKLGHSYERVMPGPNYVNSIKNFYRVYSGINDASADAVEAFLKTIISTDDYPLTRLKTTESTEMAKVLENSYRAMNISFMIEWSRFAETSGVDLYEVVKAIRLRPTHSNMMLPGIGVGGYCLTKDPVLASWASENFFDLEGGLGCSVSAVERNDMMPKYCFDFVQKQIELGELEVSKVGFLGVAYGPGIGDTRFSPVEDFYKYFMALGVQIECQDPYVPYWQELDMRIETSLSNFVNDEFDMLIITTGHQDYIAENGLYQLLSKLNRSPVIVDTVGLLDQNKLPKAYLEKGKYIVLGVG